MAFPTYVDTAANAVSVGGDTDLLPVTPTSVAAGDLLLLSFLHVNSGTQRTATYTLNTTFWTVITEGFLSSSMRGWLYYHVADGTESSITTTIVVSGGISGAKQSAYIHQFRGIDTASPIEGADDATTGTGVIIDDDDVVTTGIERLALNFLYVSNQSTPGDFVGESGGTWTTLYAPTHNATRIFLQGASLTSSITINGGSITVTNTGVWGTFGLALLPPSTSTPQSVGASGVFSGAAFGGAPIICPKGF
jgi:hypothetical protein